MKSNKNIEEKHKILMKSSSNPHETPMKSP